MAQAARLAGSRVIATENTIICAAPLLCLVLLGHFRPAASYHHKPVSPSAPARRLLSPASKTSPGPPIPSSLLEPGPAGSWDSTDALNPSVVRFEGRYLNFYSGFDGQTWRTGLATSGDGLAWEKHPANPLFGPDRPWEGDYIAANGATVVRADQILHWHQAGPRNQTRIGSGHTSDGLAWERAPELVLGHGPVGSWDESAKAL
ncbi:MAG: hypothetical protein R2748_34395 [Bryobacterales bacterium]